MSHVGTDTRAVCATSRIGLCLYRQHRDHRNAPVEVTSRVTSRCDLRTFNVLQPCFNRFDLELGVGGNEEGKGNLFTPKESSLSSASAAVLPPLLPDP